MDKKPSLKKMNRELFNHDLTKIKRSYERNDRKLEEVEEVEEVEEEKV